VTTRVAFGILGACSLVYECFRIYQGSSMFARFAGATTVCYEAMLRPPWPSMTKTTYSHILPVPAA